MFKEFNLIKGLELPKPLCFTAEIAVNYEIYLFGGQTDDIKYTDGIYLLDIRSESSKWEKLDMTCPVTNMYIATVYDDVVHLFGCGDEKEGHWRINISDLFDDSRT